MHTTEDGTKVADDDPRLNKARERVQHGKKFLDENVPGWLERAKQSSVFEMGTMDYCALAITCKGAKLNGHHVYTAGDVCRAFPELKLGSPEFGFYETENYKNYDFLQIAWEEVFGRGIVLHAA